MKLQAKLKTEKVQNQIREIGINPNHWYPVLWCTDLAKNQVKAVVVWKQNIVIYRDSDGKVHGLENACAHKGVALEYGEIHDNNLACPYHGWEFDDQGDCVRIPYFPSDQKLPCAKVKSYAVQEKYNIIWVFGGDRHQAQYHQIPDVPEYDDPDWLVVYIPAHFKAHFSICNENTMDVFHGHLHRDLQGWFDPVLLDLHSEENTVTAKYQVSYKGKISRFLNLSSNDTEVTTRNISIQYNYPHYHSSLEGLSAIYLMRLPVHETETKSFSLLFIKLRLPKMIMNLFRKQISWIVWNFLFKNFLEQDIQMVESEQRSYLANPKRNYVEINPAIIALQRLNLAQYNKYIKYQSLPKESLIESAETNPS